MTLEAMIHGLTQDEKLVAMEMLWRELSRRPSDIPAPDWHGDVLSERQAAVREGRTQFVSWSDAKQRLRDRLE